VQFSSDFFEANRDTRAGDYGRIFEALSQAQQSKDPRRALAATAALEGASGR
jgi:hypothetical protein